MDGVKDEKFYYYGGSLKNLIFREGGGGHKKPIYWGELPKKGCGEFADLRGSAKRGGGVFEGELTLQCTLY